MIASILKFATALALIAPVAGLATDAYARQGPSVDNPTISAAYTYEPCGQPVVNSSSDSANTVLRTTYQQAELELSGHYNLGARQLDPQNCGLNRQDPIVNLASHCDANTYAYACRNPISVADPGGLAEDCLDDGLGRGCPSAAQAPPDNKPSLSSPLPFSPTLGLIPDSLLNAPPSTFPQPQTIEYMVRASLFLAMLNPYGGSLGLGVSLGAGVIDNQLFGGGIQSPQAGFLMLASGGKAPRYLGPIATLVFDRFQAGGLKELDMIKDNTIKWLGVMQYADQMATQQGAPLVYLVTEGPAKTVAAVGSTNASRLAYTVHTLIGGGPQNISWAPVHGNFASGLAVAVDRGTGSWLTSIYADDVNSLVQQLTQSGAIKVPMPAVPYPLPEYFMKEFDPTMLSPASLTTPIYLRW